MPNSPVLTGRTDHVQEEEIQNSQKKKAIEHNLTPLMKNMRNLNLSVEAKNTLSKFGPPKVAQ
jgi:hypothetical protein